MSWSPCDYCAGQRVIFRLTGAGYARQTCPRCMGIGELSSAPGPEDHAA